MRFHELLAVVGAIGLMPTGHAIAAKSFTGWDCCKPACAWQTNLRNVQGSPAVCNINNGPLSNSLTAQSGCSGGAAYLCDSYMPVPATETMSYGFAIMNGNGNCCKCFQLTWTSGNAKGKSMVVQAINLFDATGDVKNGDIVILTPGGGSGPNEVGCRSQYGKTWGQSGGGVASAADCANLPQNLQGGCYWRWNWARGAVNTWGIEYTQVACPARLTSISGCSA
ncbi:beta-1,4-endoglucanase [Podospora didyma]|uniref:cellulase n=1 Tax=Podospora didyma TaxID=330526 RepID=A0AAE0KIZ2_9PEZI|nr:beta-1,4-endoglucanase [Podospora didyma]